LHDPKQKASAAEKSAKQEMLILEAAAPDQCSDGLSSLLLVAHRIDAAKAAMMTETTK